MNPLAGLDATLDALRDVGADFHRRGWSLGTSSNYSVVLARDPLELVVTASGADKGRLERSDFVRIDGDGAPTAPGQPAASAEALLHVAAAKTRQAGAVLHTHSVWSTLLSDHYFDDGAVPIEGFEMLKGLPGIDTHQRRVQIEIVDNTQDIAALAAQVTAQATEDDRALQYGYLIRRHGLYTWGRDLPEARKHVEVLEFLFECVGRRIAPQHE